MRDLLNPDRPLLSFLTKMTYSAYLNILWLICSLPVFTIGASTTALFYVTLKMAEDRTTASPGCSSGPSGRILSPATKIWLILLAVGGVFGVDAMCSAASGAKTSCGPCCPPFDCGRHRLPDCAALRLPLLARFENTTFGILKTSLLVGLRYLVCTLLMAAVYAFMGWLVIFVFTRPSCWGLAAAPCCAPFSWSR